MFRNCCGKGSCKFVKTVFGILFGAAIGVILGLLFAPKSGKETREKLSGKAEAVKDEINYKTHELKDKVVEKAEKVQEDLNEITDELKEKVIETAEKVQEEIIVKAEEIKEKVIEKVNTIKSHKDEEDTDYFEDIILDAEEESSDDNELDINNVELDDSVILEGSSVEKLDTAETDGVTKEQEVVVNKPKRTRKKAKAEEEKTDTDAEA